MRIALLTAALWIIPIQVWCDDSLYKETLPLGWRGSARVNATALHVAKNLHQGFSVSFTGRLNSFYPDGSSQSKDLKQTVYRAFSAEPASLYIWYDKFIERLNEDGVSMAKMALNANVNPGVGTFISNDKGLAVSDNHVLIHCDHNLTASWRAEFEGDLDIIDLKGDVILCQQTWPPIAVAVSAHTGKVMWRAELAPGRQETVPANWDFAVAEEKRLYFFSSEGIRVGEFSLNIESRVPVSVVRKDGVAQMTLVLFDKGMAFYRRGGKRLEYLNVAGPDSFRKAVQVGETVVVGYDGGTFFRATPDGRLQIGKSKEVQAAHRFEWDWTMDRATSELLIADWKSAGGHPGVEMRKLNVVWENARP
jgi:hypothetical protein